MALCGSFSTVLLISVVACSFSVSQAGAQELNVYGQPLQRCGGADARKDAGSGDGGRCTFRNYDAGAHQVCVDQLPHGFSSQTGQGPWSNQYTGDPWCICIWAFSHWTNHLPEDQAVPLRCDAVSSKVVDSDFATRHLKSCRAPPCDSMKSIRRLCQTCTQQAGAGNADGQKYLAGKCKAMGVTEAELGAAPALLEAGGGGCPANDDKSCAPEGGMPAVNLKKADEL